jgi:D-alanine-D-alanine ligase
MESGRNIYEKLSSSADYEPLPLFLTGNDQQLHLYRLPLNIMLKDNADDIKEKVTHFSHNSVLDEIAEEAAHITDRYNPTGMVKEPDEVGFEELKNLVEGVFIALHGRPGEDGTLQKELDKYGLYYNGSKSHSSAITINKFVTNEKLRQAGFLVADHFMLSKTEWLAAAQKAESELIQRFGLPLIAKPADDGCSAAVRKVKTPEELHNFISGIFRNEALPSDDIRQKLGLSKNEEFPRKDELLIEKFIDKGDAVRFLEITGGMLTHRQSDGSVRYEIFEPSESLAESEILSLEEKFLAGQGQNITPSRFSKDAAEQQRISSEVQKTLHAVAKTLDVTGYCRVDAFVKIFENGQIETWIIEVNSLPGMTPATCIYHQAAINGYKPFEFIREILKFGEENRPANV